MKLKYLLFFIVLFPFISYSQIIQLGNGVNGFSNTSGPANTGTATNTASRYAYIFPEQLLNGLKHGDSIRSIEFHRNGGDSLTGSCEMKIYFRNSANSTFGTGFLNWNNRIAATRMEKVYDKDPIKDIGRKTGWVKFDFSTPYFYDTTFGKNIELLVEYKTNNSQNATIFWSYDYNGINNNLIKFSRVVGTLPDSFNSTTVFHPDIRFYFPRPNYLDAKVNYVYSLGKLPVPIGNPDTIKALIHNLSLSSRNIKIYLESKGANNLKDSGIYSFNSMQEKLINLPLLYPTNKGMDTLTVRIDNDSNNNNNTFTVYRLATLNIYSYRDVTRPIAGGIGFNGATGDFVAKFYVDTIKKINQISVNFSGVGRKFKLGIWSVNSQTGLPDTLTWQSDTLTSAVQFVTPVLPAVQVKGHYFVGVRQIETVNVAFGYQPEEPVREKTFVYTSPTGSSNWTDFYPSAPYKFAIEPRIQAFNDVAPLKVVEPKDTISFVTVKTMAPKASIINYGSNNQTTAFSTTYQIRRFNTVVYNSTRSDTLSSGLRRTLVFDSTFLPTVPGDYSVSVFTRLANDELKDNDTLRYTIVVANFKDVGPSTLFEPYPGNEYEQFIDTIFPTVIIQNYGLDNQGPFNVKVKLYDSAKNVVYVDNQSFTLTSLNNIIGYFKPFPCSIKGKYTSEVYTELATDTRTKNDTLRSYFSIIRSNDVAITEVYYPTNNQVISIGSASKRPSVKMENLGDYNQSDDFPTYCKIYYKDSLVYYDSALINSFRSIPATLNFKFFSPTLLGYYKMVTYTNLETDQYRKNDTITINFSYGLPDDVQMLSITPINGSLIELNSVYKPQATIKNNGIFNQNTPFNVVFNVLKNNTLIYQSIKSTTLNINESKTINFDSTLKISESGVYDVIAYTNLSNDFLKNNDTILANYFTKITYNYTISEIEFPKNNDSLLLNTQIINPKVIVQKTGDSFSSSPTWVYIEISDLVSQNIVFKDSLQQTISQEFTTYIFNDFGPTTVNSKYEIFAYCKNNDDNIAKDDSAKNKFLYHIFYDLESRQVIKPHFENINHNATPFQPKYRFHNYGSKKSENVKVILTITQTFGQNLGVVYQDSITYSEVNPLSVNNDSMVKLFNPSQAGIGSYETKLEIISSNDQVSTNNIFIGSFAIIQNTNVLTIQNQNLKIYPNPTHSSLFISSENKETLGKIIIFDLSGKTVFEAEIESSNTEISTQNLNSGDYFIQVNGQFFKFAVLK